MSKETILPTAHTKKNNNINLAMIVAQLVERLLSTSKVRGSNTFIGEFLYRTFVFILSAV